MVSLANSSKTPSITEQTASSVMLNIKPNQNLILDLDSSKYADSLKHMIECLRYSPLVQPLMMDENVPLVHLFKAFSIASYQHSEAMITFEVDSHKTSISKARSSRMQGIYSTVVVVYLESISSSTILEMFYLMGYLENLSLVSKFKKPNLPPMWNGLFTPLFKSFSE
ncbi:unnamed protein product [Lactuca saligna]|uniref:Uncharacterized protein n=1 Tax=Lactuca saligna TaxID=75948 RepID=A0AA35YBM4_LACSI|nr:unnamed protein product [Lactuca saligna]